MKTGEWIKNSNEPLNELEDVQFCQPDPHSGWVSWQEMILACFVAGDPDKVCMENGSYFPDKQEFVTMSGEARIAYENGKWTYYTIPTTEMPMISFPALIYAYYPISPLPDFEATK